MGEGTGSEKSALELIAEVFRRHEVRFVVVGGQAELLHGSPRVTWDVNVCYDRAADNLDRLSDALKELKPRLRDAPPDLPLHLDSRSLALGSNFTLSTTAGDLDLMRWLEPVGGYVEIASRAETMRVGEEDLLVLSLDDLIRIRRHLSRAKDRESLLQLEAIRRIRGEGQ